MQFLIANFSIIDEISVLNFYCNIEFEIMNVFVYFPLNNKLYMVQNLP